MYPLSYKAGGDGKYDNLKSLQDSAGQCKVATREDYENEALYTVMTRRYNVINFYALLVTLSFKYNDRIWIIQVYNQSKFQETN